MHPTVAATVANLHRHHLLAGAAARRRAAHATAVLGIIIPNGPR